MSWPALTIIGSSSAVSAAASATAEPDRADSRIAATMATYPSPPLMCPTKAKAKLTMRWLSPPTFMISPASMKNGTASSGKLFEPSIRYCASTWASNWFRCHISATPVASSA